MSGNYESVLNEFAKYKKDKIFISAHTLAELYYGAENSEKKAHNFGVIDGFLTRVNVLEFDSIQARIYAKIRSELNAKNRKIGDMDMLIASCAIAKNFTLVTNNEKDFNTINGLKVENWTK